MKNTHRKIQKNLSAYVDGELKIDQFNEVDLHVATCRECAEVVAGLQQNRQMFQQFRQESPVDIWTTIQDRIEPRKNAFHKINNFILNLIFKPIPIVAVVILTFALSFSIIHLNQQTQTIDEPIDSYLSAYLEYQTSDLVVTYRDLPSETADTPDQNQEYLDLYFGF